MKIGYARISTDLQDLDTQLNALKNAGCEKIFQEVMSGAERDNRPELEKCFMTLRKGDTLVVYSICRLGRTNKDLVNMVDDLEKQGIHFYSITESIRLKHETGIDNFDGKLILSVYGMLAETQRKKIRKSTYDGMINYRMKGNPWGRKRKLDEDREQLLMDMYNKPNEYPIKKILNILGISKVTLYNYINRAREKERNPLEGVKEPIIIIPDKPKTEW